MNRLFSVNQFDEYNSKTQRFITRAVYLLVFICYALRLYWHVMTSQLAGSPLLFPVENHLFWLLNAAAIPQTIISTHWLALALDISIFASCVLCIVYTEQLLFRIILFVLTLLYYVIFSNAMGYQPHDFIGVFMIMIPFLVRSGIRFNVLWQFMRYYMCYAMVCVAYAKYDKGSLQYEYHMINVLKSQYADYMPYLYGSLREHLWLFLLKHHTLGKWLYYASFVAEMSFIIGFFTRRLDRLLFLAGLSFFIADYMIMDISFHELALLLLPFLNWNSIIGWYDAFRSKLFSTTSDKDSSRLIAVKPLQ